jgi:4-alpha-glucanotransferase
VTLDVGPLARRRAGVLLHVSSLPGGRLGPAAYAFVDFLAAVGCTVWQVLPLVPPDEEGSPYRALSAMAGHPGLLDPARPQPPSGTAYRDWYEHEEDWLEPYVEYLTVRTSLGGAPWPDWQPALRDRDPRAVADVVSGAPALADRVRAEQWRFAEQSTVGCCSTATCRSSSPSTARTSGPTARSSDWTPRDGRRR